MKKYELYGPPTEKLADFCNYVLQSGIQSDVGTVIPVPINYKSEISETLQVLNECCDNCSADHNVWIIAGGYATFLMKKTNFFNDIDIFVYCNGTLT